MNAIKFIQQHGVDVAREAIEEANAYGGFYLNGKTLELSNHAPLINAVFIPDLKRLVESIDIIKELGGLESAKANVREMYIDSSCDYVHPKVVLYDYKHIEIGRAIKAIADYEQLFGNTETLELETLRDCDTSPNCKKFDERVK